MSASRRLAVLLVKRGRLKYASHTTSGRTSLTSAVYQCDLKRPSCQKCISLKRQCLGYADSWTVVLRQMNDHVAEQVQARVSRRLKERRAAARKSTVPRSVQLNLESQSLLLFHESYIATSGISFFRTLPDIYFKNPSGPLQNALEAVALASCARRFFKPNLMALARQHYGKAISSMNASLRNPVSAKDDTVLVSLFVLGLFEVGNFLFVDNAFTRLDARSHELITLRLLLQNFLQAGSQTLKATVTLIPEVAWYSLNTELTISYTHQLTRVHSYSLVTLR